MSNHVSRCTTVHERKKAEEKENVILYHQDTFHQKEDLKTGPSFICPTCSRSFWTAVQLSYHVYEVHEKAKEKMKRMIKGIITDLIKEIPMTKLSGKEFLELERKKQAQNAHFSKMDQLKRQLSRVHEGKKGSKQLNSDKITTEPSLSITKEYCLRWSYANLFKPLTNCRSVI